jgi:hypothetical protein
MSSLWLEVPLEDYEGHMLAPEVAQLPVLADLFAEALALCRPASVAILGMAGGNGLDRIDPAMTKRVVGFDCNPVFLDAVRRRHAGLADLELHCIDLASEMVEAAPVDLVHAALVFEHAGVDLCLENAVRMVDAGGALSVVLQLPSEQAVSPSAYASIQRLRTHFVYVEPGELTAALEERGFLLDRESRRDLPEGKAFWAGIFTRLRA